MPCTCNSLVYNLYLALLVVFIYYYWYPEINQTSANGGGGSEGTSSLRGDQKFELESSSRAVYMSVYLLKGTLSLTLGVVQAPLS